MGVIFTFLDAPLLVRVIFSLGTTVVLLLVTVMMSLLASSLSSPTVK